MAQGYSIDDASARIQFRLHLGDDLFVEAARLRAFREAWAAIVHGFKPTHDCSHTTWIQAVVTYPEDAKSAYDHAIRATLQAGHRCDDSRRRTVSSSEGMGSPFQPAVARTGRPNLSACVWSAHHTTCCATKAISRDIR
ncbi:MAG: hypothetical protein IPO90_12610 [Flavobacteriales bacterium]|nr:hypothetical protein [Flavobacteriales bacterium]